MSHEQPSVPKRSATKDGLAAVAVVLLAAFLIGMLIYQLI